VTTSSPGPTPNARKRQLDRVEAGADADRVARADEGGEFRLEALDRRAEDEIAAIDDGADCLVDVAGDRRVLRAQVDERDVHGCNHCFQPRPR
jgi:hypothetical protein